MQPDENTDILQNLSFDTISSQNVGKKIICSVCEQILSSKKALKQHVEAVHEGKKTSKCSLCDYSSSKKGSLKRHVEAVHEGKKTNKCSLCDYSCSQKASLKGHVEAVHE